MEQKRFLWPLTVPVRSPRRAQFTLIASDIVWSSWAGCGPAVVVDWQCWATPRFEFNGTAAWARLLPGLKRDV